MAVVSASKYEKVSFTKTTCFETGDVTIKFLAHHDNPGFTYRVMAIRGGHEIAHGWMREGLTPTHKQAEFYYNLLLNDCYKD